MISDIILMQKREIEQKLTELYIEREINHLIKDNDLIYDFPTPEAGEDTPFIDQGIIDKKIKEFATNFNIEGEQVSLFLPCIYFLL